MKSLILAGVIIGIVIAIATTAYSTWYIRLLVRQTPLPERDFGSQNVKIFSSQVWTDTNISLRPYDRISIEHISGHWSPWSNDFFDANGAGGDPNCSCNIVPGSHASLIARIGDNPPFYIGNLASFEARQFGELYLGINDNITNDNSGSLTVRITLNVPGSPPASP